MSDPADWPTTCELGCETFFLSRAASTAPHTRHKNAGIPACEMSMALLRADRRNRSRKLRSCDARTPDVEPWARLPWNVEALVLTETYIDWT